MDPEDPGRVLAVGARLPTEAGRHARVAGRELHGVEALPTVQGRQGDLARADEVELAAVDVVHLGPVGREEPRLLHRGLAHQHRGDDGSEPFGDDPGDRPVHEGEVDEHGLPHQRREPRPAGLDAVTRLDEPHGVGQGRMVAARRGTGLADRAQHLAVVFAAVGDTRVRRVGELEHQVVQATVEDAELLLRAVHLVLQRAGLGQLGVAAGRVATDLLRDHLLSGPQLLGVVSLRALLGVER